ncbi:MAG: HAD-IA family hydrolase [Candidatus Phytoplasma stylosanthis]|uniref:YqeG family HAD IIIA-type phosphatase n=1 Tax=Candidatus Phytoplasma stylosanthis TaxID=2798314 RepID=UPI002939E8E2|nr:HAD-IA family hydrolase [Candidatus Phytoplasma stylosanthis]MDV3167945.1 HAD-IA family hydrolase [Candidatus Phytoplasma stylosanthis]MDV3171038.1 HAD-IA family hydrolase [Candidatus Phytoplasma stylosanthis]MDV3173626.1 HAD-IA family hydrolase [Candidatus Phytoplasma stylosanthis]MDV3174240.1 HAD-IA family hydrolase [Candidatus Phytoplasma stylosanthis]MDV3202703.1 HAD-IA family hydrolase [Candidatus Phytoplasma stylosanthis]
MINKYKKYLPSFYYDSIFDIPYDNFAKNKIKALFFDLDNTLLRIKEKKLNLDTQNLLKELSFKFKIFIISNASLSKLKNIFFDLKINYIYLNIFHKKPSLWGLKKALQLLHINYNEAIMIGDQLRTDVASANKMNIVSILVKPLDRKNESFITKLSRILIEKKVINNIKKKNVKEYEIKFKKFI